jgi:hypothetical protein
MPELFQDISTSTLYLILGVLGALFFLFRIAMMLIGFDDADGGDIGDVDTDFDFDGDVDMDADLQLLSVQGLAGAAMIFGFTGFTLSTATGLHGAFNLIASIAMGLFTLWLIARLYLFIRSLDSSGTVDLNTACGQEASVYLTIPPHGTGKVQAQLGGGLKVIDARTEENEAIPTGNRVLIKYVADDNILVVSPVRSEFEKL